MILAVLVKMYKYTNFKVQAPIILWFKMEKASLILQVTLHKPKTIKGQAVARFKKETGNQNVSSN